MKTIDGKFVKLDNEEYYKISNYDKMKPFLFTLANSNNVWIHLSSNGGVCAGRESDENPLFPYISEDKVYHSTDTGAKTLVKVTRDNKCQLWQPFENSYITLYNVERNIYKSVMGNSVVFEEINNDLQMIFRYKWQCCDKYGIVRKVWLENCGTDCDAEVMDGLMNIMPYGVAPVVQANWSSLIDGYKQAEIAKDDVTAIYSLTTAMVDTPSPEEMLKANIIRCISDCDFDVYISDNTLTDFANGTLEKAQRYCGDRGAYFVHLKEHISSKDSINWAIVADVGLTQNQISQAMADGISFEGIDIELDKSAENMREIIAKTDGLQCTGDKMSVVHHMSNVTFNDMRGGLFLDNYEFKLNDFVEFVKIRNYDVYKTECGFFEKIKDTTSIIELKRLAYETGNADIIRICYEYLPISFSRRHGDPSRPWNKFSIVLRDKDGNPITNYAGNWRDIFQNWEAMLISYPQYIDSVIAKFVNATSADGYNAYRITKEGIDWERINPEDPLSSLGYWGDHQIIYLSRLVELLAKLDKTKLNELLENDVFSYADIPYEIADFDSMIKDPDHTIEHIIVKDNEICNREKSMGTDARLIQQNGRVYHVAFVEKLIVPILTKLSNLVPDGGIWLNTQRPEWNDANNAIVGYGLSMVTVYQLKRHLQLCKDILRAYTDKQVLMSNEVIEWLEETNKTLNKHKANISHISPKTRMDILSELVGGFDKYKKAIYKNGFSGKEHIDYSTVNDFIDTAIAYLDSTIKSNKRKDGLYNSYNILKVVNDGIEIEELQPMLEGQVSLLGCDYLSDTEVSELIYAMRHSALYSERERTYYLYPPVHTPSFMDKGIIQNRKFKLFDLMLSDNDFSVVNMDSDGNIRFSSSITCKRLLVDALEKAKTKYTEAVQAEYDDILDVFEDTFKHSKFTGRSQVMYKYEGIGSIYWHQNSKLLVSMQEKLLKADENNRELMKELYNEIRNGLGFNKSPEQWGAFPCDAYSHTPYNGGAMQPVMTGQVKEEVITRYAELGAVIQNGCITFEPWLVNDNEYLTESAVFNTISVKGKKTAIEMPVNSLGYTICQVPVIYIKDGENKIEIEYSRGNSTVDGLTLPQDISQSIFNRLGEIDKITVHI